MISASLVILSGGRSSRMKENKAFVKIGERRIIDIVLERMLPVFKDAMIISNEPDLYADLGVPVHTDIYPRLGPVAGIHTGLVRAAEEKAIIMGCDMPFITTEAIAYMVGRSGAHQSAVPKINGFLQPLSAVYAKSCIPILEDCLQHNRLKLVRIFEELEHTVITAEELSRFGKPDELFMNVNDPETLAKAQRIWGGG
ncbi:MAG: molybdenum cofactor guanylyltransferase [Syntrophomonadaceae bacterium]|nr:molybdenum cofactor guanylyltransferase [Syntrophomonadaceae bacterium]